MSVHSRGRIEMSQQERDRLKVLHGVEQGQYSQAKAAQLLNLTVRQVRRLQQRCASTATQAWCIACADGRRIIGSSASCASVCCASTASTTPASGPRWRARSWPSKISTSRTTRYGVGCSTRACGSANADATFIGSVGHVEACFGELVQMDTSLHAWMEGRGEEMVLITMIDDATSRLLARFYPGDTVEAHFDLLGRWIQKYGRPLALYTDRHGIFKAHKKGQPDYAGETQFGRALAELGIGLIKARSPQAKGRVERSFGTAQDRWVKEMRLAKVKTIVAANALLERLLPDHNRRFGVAPAQAADAHRAVGKTYHLAAILSVQEERVVSNDYTIRFENRLYQLDRPIYPGERGGKVTIEMRLEGAMAIRFGSRYLNYHEIAARDPASSFSAFAAYARGGSKQGRRFNNGSVVPWRKADQRALGSHSCGALSSRWRERTYQKRPVPAKCESPLAQRFQKTGIGKDHHR